MDDLCLGREQRRGTRTEHQEESTAVILGCGRSPRCAIYATWRSGLKKCRKAFKARGLLRQDHYAKEFADGGADVVHVLKGGVGVKT